MTIAIIGTAGRDKFRTMTRALWDWMVADALARVPKGAHLVSGGAAWADHLAIDLMFRGHAGALTLHLPAPFADGQFIGPFKSAASAANFYHGKFSEILNWNTLMDIQKVAALPNVDGSIEPAQYGYAGMFARNLKVARADEMLAYTFGPGDEPADGGTKDTWNKCSGKKTHVSLLRASK